MTNCPYGCELPLEKHYLNVSADADRNLRYSINACDPFVEDIIKALKRRYVSDPNKLSLLGPGEL